MRYTDRPDYKLFKALRKGFLEQAEMYIEQGCDIHRVTENDKWTYLHQLSDGDTPVQSLQFLLDQGLDINAIDSYGNTPLIYAVRQRNIDGIRLLLENGADKLLEHENEDSVSALRMGFDRMPFDYDVFKILLEHGANPDIKIEGGKTVREMLDVLSGIDEKTHKLFKQY